MGTIGEMERLAGVEDRREFWRKFDHTRYRSTQEYIDAAMFECRRMVARRIVRGELSLLVPDRDIERYVKQLQGASARRAARAQS